MFTDAELTGEEISSFGLPEAHGGREELLEGVDAEGKAFEGGEVVVMPAVLVRREGDDEEAAFGGWLPRFELVELADNADGEVEFLGDGGDGYGALDGEREESDIEEMVTDFVEVLV